MPSLAVFGHQIEFSQFHGVVEDLQHWSTTQTWTEGGGGWVHPQYGGWVEAPVTRSRTDHHQRVRVLWASGERSTVDLPGHVQLSKGDHAVFLVAENKAARLWAWTGGVNFTIRTTFAVGDAGGVARYSPKGILAKIGALYWSVRAATGDARTVVLAWIMMTGLAAFVVNIPIYQLNKLILDSGFRHSNWADGYWVAVAIVAVAAFVGWQRFMADLKAGAGVYDGERSKLLQTILQTKQNVVAPAI
jgi:hypothetical protein